MRQSPSILDYKLLLCGRMLSTASDSRAKHRALIGTQVRKQQLNDYGWIDISEAYNFVRMRGSNIGSFSGRDPGRTNPEGRLRENFETKVNFLFKKQNFKHKHFYTIFIQIFKIFNH